MQLPRLLPTRRAVLLVPLTAVTLLAACSSGSGHDAHDPTPVSRETSPSTAQTPASDHVHGDSSLPTDIPTAAHPRFAVGSRVLVRANHMPGMAGATATVTGAYDTYTYAVTYTPTTGGAPVVDHKWVVQQEIKDAGTARLADGTAVTLLADHMPGMDGATGTVVSSTDETVYTITLQADGMTMTNHKWVVEDELAPTS